MAACGLWGSMFIWQVAKRCSNISKFTSTYQQQHGTFLALIPLMNFNMGALTWIPFFPECVARVPISLWGSGGWGCVRSSLRLCTFATIRNRSQPFATIRNRSQPQPSATVRANLVYGRALISSANFWRFHIWRCFVSHGRRGTSWHSDVFGNVSKVVLCGWRNTFATFS